MSHQEFDKLKAIYSQLIGLVCYAKETDSEDERLDCFFKMFQLVRACLDFSPYTHFYTQVLIDIIIKTYNTKTFRTDLLFKSQIGVLIEDSKYYPNEFYRDLEEDEYTPEILLIKWRYGTSLIVGSPTAIPLLVRILFTISDLSSSCRKKISTS